MASTPQIQFRRSNGNLFISLPQNFTESIAAELTFALKNSLGESGNIFINTVRLQNIDSAACVFFRNHLHNHVSPHGRIYYIGANGLKLGGEGSKVIIPPQRKCAGRCGKNTCHGARALASNPKVF